MRGTQGYSRHPWKCCSEFEMRSRQGRPKPRPEGRSRRFRFWLLNPRRQPSTPGMKEVTAVLWAAAVLLMADATAHAWSGAGHQVIAAEAYRELSPALQKKVVQLLEAHPQYAKWKESLRNDAGDPEAGMEIFLRASTWPARVKMPNLVEVVPGLMASTRPSARSAALAVLSIVSGATFASPAC